MNDEQKDIAFRIPIFIAFYIVVSWMCEDHETYFFKLLFLLPGVLIILYPLLGIVARKVFRE